MNFTAWYDVKKADLTFYILILEQRESRNRWIRYCANYWSQRINALFAIIRRFDKPFIVIIVFCLYYELNDSTSIYHFKLYAELKIKPSL